MLLSKKNIFSIAFLSLSLCIMAQKKKADKLYDKAQYYKAISYYEKAIKTNNATQKQESLIKLADCYRVLNEYKKSETYYREALALGNVNPEVNYNYGNVLKSNNNYSEALNNYMVYLEAKPEDKKATYAVKSSQEIKYWQSKPQEYQVKDLEGINTKRSEFCPAVLNNKLVFIGEKQNDYLEFATSDLNGQPYLNVFYTDIKNTESGKVKQLSGKINSNYHDGPVSFSADGKTMFLTRVNYIVNKRNKDFVNRAKLYISTGSDKSWSKPKPFQYNSDEYSCAHASLSADGTLLYFTSDMPGGFGGKDIWMCKKNGDGWDKPVNLGLDINPFAPVYLRNIFPNVTTGGSNVTIWKRKAAKGSGVPQMQNAMEIDHTKPHPFRKFPKGHQREGQPLMGRPRFYLIVEDGQGELYIDGNGKLRVTGAKDDGGFARARYEIPLYSHRNAGQKKIDDDWIDSARGIMATFGVESDKLTQSEQIDALIPEKYKPETLKEDYSYEREMSVNFQVARAKQKIEPEVFHFDEHLEPEMSEWQ